MNTFFGIIFLILSMIGIVVIFFIFYALRYSFIEKKVRELLSAEFKLKTEQTMKILDDERIAREKIWTDLETEFKNKIKEHSDKNKKLDDEKEKMKIKWQQNEVEMQNTIEMRCQKGMNANIELGKKQAKKEILKALEDTIFLDYGSDQLKRRFYCFLEKAKERIQF